MISRELVAEILRTFTRVTEVENDDVVIVTTTKVNFYQIIIAVLLIIKVLNM